MGEMLSLELCGYTAIGKGRGERHAAISLQIGSLTSLSLTIVFLQVFGFEYTFQSATLHAFLDKHHELPVIVSGDPILKSRLQTSPYAFLICISKIFRHLSPQYVQALLLYMFMILYAPTSLRGRVPLVGTGTVAAWNLILAAFSVIGTLRTLPYLVQKVHEEGLRFSLCTSPADWYANGPVGFWVSAFILSKYVELFDTVLLVLRGR